MVVVAPGQPSWPVPAALAVAGTVGEAIGISLMAAASTALGRELTAVPLPNEDARLRTGGMYRRVRAPSTAGCACSP